MTDRPTIDATILLAVRLHAGQRDKAGVPYVAHLMAVMRGVPEAMRHVAVLHDAIEDGRITLHRLLALGYDRDEVDAISDLTRSRSETYAAYIERLVTSGSAIAIAVKIADLYDNLARGGIEPSLQKRYRTALLRLETCGGGAS